MVVCSECRVNMVVCSECMDLCKEHAKEVKIVFISSDVIYSDTHTL